jgi:hypothetical protein
MSPRQIQKKCKERKRISLGACLFQLFADFCHPEAEINSLDVELTFEKIEIWLL